MIDRQTIYISAYPKSGSTWLTRLLGDVLNSPTGGCMPEEDVKEVATEGQDRPGPYLVRKGHFVLIDDDGPGPVVPRPHRLAWKRLTNERIVFLVRDPRDICVSGAWHWRQTPEQFLERMIKGDVAKCGRWDEYVERWLSFFDDYDPDHNYQSEIYWFTYEGLLYHPDTTLFLTLRALDITFKQEQLNVAINRQSFGARAAQIGDDPKELRRNNMRKGIVGDWRNHFTPKMNERIWSEFGWMMERLGYAKD